MMLKRGASYDEVCRNFRWDVPAFYNIADDVCDRIVAAIGVPDPVRTEIIKAFVILNDGYEGTDALAEELRQAVRARLAKHEVTRLIEFVTDLPMTTTGKIMRRELRLAEARKAAGT